MISLVQSVTRRKSKGCWGCENFKIRHGRRWPRRVYWRRPPNGHPARAEASAKEWGLDPKRSYQSYAEMAVQEAARADGIDAVAIVTPNHMHAGPAIAFLEAGIHVICDKPLAATSEQAQLIDAAVRASKAHFILTHNYTGYPVIRQARKLVENGELGAHR